MDARKNANTITSKSLLSGVQVFEGRWLRPKLQARPTHSNLFQKLQIVFSTPACIQPMRKLDVRRIIFVDALAGSLGNHHGWITRVQAGQAYSEPHPKKSSPVSTRLARLISDVTNFHPSLSLSREDTTLVEIFPLAKEGEGLRSLHRSTRGLSVLPKPSKTTPRSCE